MKVISPTIRERRLREEQKDLISTDFNMEFTVKHLGRNRREDWKCEVDEYVVTFKNFITAQTYSMPFYSGVGNADSGRVVKPFDVLSCIRLDNTRGASFEEWCWEFGYDTDSKKALETYLACQKQTDDFQRVFPNVDLDSYEPLENY